MFLGHEVLHRGVRGRVGVLARRDRTARTDVALKPLSITLPALTRHTRRRSTPSPSVARAAHGEQAEADSSNDENALLSVSNVAIAFGDAAEQVEVVSDVSFSMRPGEVVGLVGESGCGRSVTGPAFSA